jgi:hypothetical protein
MRDRGNHPGSEALPLEQSWASRLIKSGSRTLAESGSGSRLRFSYQFNVTIETNGEFYIEKIVTDLFFILTTSQFQKKPPALHREYLTFPNIKFLSFFLFGSGSNSENALTCKIQRFVGIMPNLSFISVCNTSIPS